MNLSGKTAVITGASSGIGAALAKAFARLGVRVALVARRKDRLESLAAEIAAAGGTARAYPADVGDWAAFQAAARAIEADLGPVDIIVNNAGFGHKRPFLEEPLEEIERETRVNYFGTVYGMKLFLPGMVDRRSGFVINVASVAGSYHSPHMGVYCATKAAQIALGNSTRSEIEPLGVRLITLCPGPVDTEFHSGPTWAGVSRRPGLVTAKPEDCVRAVLRAMERGKPTVYVYRFWGLGLWVINLLGPGGKILVGIKRKLGIKF